MANASPTGHDVRSTTGIWVGSLVLECRDLPRMARFWEAALHYVRRRPHEDGEAFLIDPERRGPNLNLQRATEALPKGYRLHLDLYATDPKGEVERLLRLGATLDRGPTAGHDFVTLADPDGNLFDVIDLGGPVTPDPAELGTPGRSAKGAAPD